MGELELTPEFPDDAATRDPSGVKECREPFGH
jgi:hypothetical protein